MQLFYIFKLYLYLYVTTTFKSVLNKENNKNIETEYIIIQLVVLYIILYVSCINIYHMANLQDNQNAFQLLIKN